MSRGRIKMKKVPKLTKQGKPYKNGKSTYVVSGHMPGHREPFRVECEQKDLAEAELQFAHDMRAANHTYRHPNDKHGKR